MRARYAPQQGVAICRRACNLFRTDSARRAAAIVDDDWLAQAFSQFLCDGAANDVGGAAGRVGDYAADGFYRVGLPCSCRCGLRLRVNRGSEQGKDENARHV